MLQPICLEKPETARRVKQRIGTVMKWAIANGWRQDEALRKHRNGGKQTVRVERVHVHQGGQAIVGDVRHGGRVEDEK